MPCWRRPHGPPPRAASAPRCVNGLYWLLAALANRNPMLLALDDVHWADEATLRFLGFLQLRLDSVPALVVIGTQPAPGDALLAHPDTVTLRLRGLGRDSVRALVTERLGDAPDDAFVDACLAATGGNPFLLVDLLGTLRSDGVRPVSRARARGRGGQPRERGPLRRRTTHPARTRPHDAGPLARDRRRRRDARLRRRRGRAADRRSAAAAADALVLAGLLDANLRFEHPLVRTAVLGGIAPGERLRLNEIAARLLQQAGAPAEHVAVHLQATEPAGNEHTAAVLADAGPARPRARCARGRRRLLARALAEPPAASAHVALLRDLGRAETAAGVPARASGCARSSSARPTRSCGRGS